MPNQEPNNGDDFNRDVLATLQDPTVFFADIEAHLEMVLIDEEIPPELEHLPDCAVCGSSSKLIAFDARTGNWHCSECRHALYG